MNQENEFRCLIYDLMIVVYPHLKGTNCSWALR